MHKAEPYTIYLKIRCAPRRFCGAAWQAARRLLTGTSGGLPTRRRLPACPTRTRGSGALCYWPRYLLFLSDSTFLKFAGTSKSEGSTAFEENVLSSVVISSSEPGAPDPCPPEAC